MVAVAQVSGEGGSRAEGVKRKGEERRGEERREEGWGDEALEQWEREPGDPTVNIQPSQPSQPSDTPPARVNTTDLTLMDRTGQGPMSAGIRLDRCKIE